MFTDVLIVALYSVACPGIRKGEGGGEGFFLLLLFNFARGGPAQNIAEKIIFLTKKSSKI